MNAFELSVHSDHHDGLEYRTGYRLVIEWYSSENSLIHSTDAQSPSRSSIPGNVRPSFVQPPPFAAKYLAWSVALELGEAKW